MFSSFLTNPRNRRKVHDGLQHPSKTTTTSALDEEERNLGLPHPTEHRRHRRVRGRRESAETGTADASPDAGASSVGSRSYNQESPTPMTSTGHPIPRQTTSTLIGYDDHSRDVGVGPSSSPSTRNPIGAGAAEIASGNGSVYSTSKAREWREQEIKRPSSRASSRARTLYPLPKLDSQPSDLESTISARSSRPPRPTRPMTAMEVDKPYEADAGIVISISPPEVVRLDSQGSQSRDEGGRDQYQRVSEPPYEDSFPRSNPNTPFAYVPSSSSNLNTNTTTSRDTAATSRYQGGPLRGASPLSWQRQSASQNWNQSPQRQQQFSPPIQPPSETQSEADFYASAVEDQDFETDFEGSVGEPVAIPLPARSTTSTSSSSRSVPSSAASTGASADPASGSAHAMTKQRWGLRLQVQQLNRNRHPGDRSGTALPEGGESSSDLSLNSHSSSQQQISTLQPSLTPDFPASSVDDTGDSSDTRHALLYPYPHGHPLSPIEEQDYISPSPHSSKEDERATSIKFRGGSTNVLSSLTLGEMRGRPSSTSLKRDKEEGEVDGDDKASIRTGRSIRTGSVGSVNMSRAGSGGVEAGTNPGLHNCLKLSSGPSPNPLGTPNVDAPRPSPFLTRQLNRTISQTSTKSWTTESMTGQPTPVATPTHSSAHPSPRVEGMVPGHIQSMQARTIISHLPASRLGGAIGRVGAASGEAESTTPNISGSGTAYSPTSTLQQTASSNTSAPQTATTIQPPPGAIVTSTPAVPTAHGGPTVVAEGGAGRATGIPKLPSIPTFDLRFSMLGSVSPRSSSSRRVDRMPVIQDGGSGEGYPGSEKEDEYEDVDIEEDEEYERQSLHADSFVTAGDENNEAGGDRATTEREGIELDSINGNKDVEGGNGESFIHRRWERDAALGTGEPVSSDFPIVLARSGSGLASLTPAFWTFWLGFGFPVLWLIGGWHFTNAGEMPPKYTFWEWYFWNRRWRPRRWFRKLKDGLCGCCGSRRRQSRTRIQRTRKAPPTMTMDTRESLPDAKARAGMVYPSLPRWVAEKQSTDDGRMKLNDPKRSLRGIQFGYPFVPPYGSGGHHRPSTFRRMFTSPNRILNQLYGVQLKEVHGRPETGRRMFDPWVQRCRYAFCYALLLLAAGLCTASAYLIVVNTRNLH